MISRGFRIARRFLRGQYGRTGMTVLAVALGVALVCALDVVTRSMSLAFEEIIDTMAGRVALEVSAGEGGLVPEDLAARIAPIPGVELAVPAVRAVAFLSGEGEALTVHGVDVLNEPALRAYEAVGVDGQLLDDPIRFLADPRGIIVTRAMAERRGLHEGDSLDLETPHGRRRFRILSLLEPRGVGRVYGGNLVVMDVAAAEDAFTERGLVSRIDVVVARDAHVEDVRAALQAVLPGGMHVITPAQRKIDLQNVMRAFGWLLRAIGMVGVIVAFFIAFSGMSAAFERRAWQLGVLAAIGARPHAIWMVQMQEALLVAFASAGVGIALGVGLAHVMLPVIATATALNFNVVAPDARVIPTMGTLATAAVLGVVVTVLAAWIPAARAVRVGAAATMRDKGQERRPASPTRTWTIAGSVCGIAAIAVAVQWWAGSVAAGLAATVSIAVATATTAIAIVPVAATVALPILSGIGGASGRLAAIALRESPRRIGMTTATIAVGVAAVTWLLILARSFEGSVVDALGRAIRADLVVTSSNIGSGFLEAPLASEAVTAVKEVPGIGAVAGWRALEWAYRGSTVGISAYDPVYFLDRRFGEWPLQAAAGDDVWTRVAAGDGVVVSTSFVSSFGKSVGDALELETPTGPLVLPILGVTIDFVSPKGTIEISRDVYAMRWRDRSGTRIFALTMPSVAAADVRRSITSSLGTRFAIRVLSAKELLDYFTQQVRRAFAIIPLFAGMVYVVIAVGLTGSLVSSVLDRRRELAIVGAIGLPGRRTRLAVVLEAITVGVMGLAVAVLGGSILAGVWVRGTFQLLLGWTLVAEVPATSLGIVALATMLVCYLASLVPARHASTVAVADVLRYE